MKIRRFFLFFLFFGLFIVFKNVFSYDNLIIHPHLTQIAIETYNQEVDKEISSKEAGWIVHGSIAEDTDPRYLRHFYNPRTGLGLSFGFQYASAKSWALDQSSASGDYDVATILDNYRNGDRERAFQGIGHILHLIQDMSVPAHVRDDEHTFGDPYEQWLKNTKVLVSGEYEKISIVNIETIFDDLANYTYDNFFSKDTVILDLLNGCDDIILEKNSLGENIEYCIKDNQKLVGLKRKLEKTEYLFDEKVHQDYWGVLHPLAVGYSAGTIGWFMDEFEKIDEENSKLSFLDKIENFFVNNYKNIAYLYGDLYLPGQVLREDGLKELKDTWDFSKLVYESGKEAVVASAQKINNEAEKAVVLLDKTIDQSSANAKKAVSGVVEQIKVLGEDFVYQESEASAATLTVPNSVVGNSNWEIVEVERVIDGDTIVLKNGDRVRYIGIDAPELNKAGAQDDECLAWVAKVRNEQLLKTGQISLVSDSGADKDKYGRLLRYVYVGNNFVNATLAREGLAEIFFCGENWENCPYMNDETRKELIEAAGESARNSERGIYSQACFEKEKLSVNLKEDKGSEEIVPANAENFIVLHFSGEALLEDEIKNIDNNSTEQETVLAVSFFSLFDLQTLSREYTASSTVGVEVEIQNPDLAETFCLSEAEIPPDFLDPCWLALSLASDGGTRVSATYELSIGDELKKVYLFIRQGENIIKSYTTIYLDTQSLQIYFVETPYDYASSSEASFILGANKEVIGEYSLDNASSTFANIGEEIDLDNLLEGEHNFYFSGLAQSGEIASTSFAWVVDLTSPTINLEVLQSGDDFNLSWQGEDISIGSTTPSGIDFYNIFYQLASTSPWEIILAETEATSTNFTLASSDEDIIFGAEAIDRAGNKSELILASSSGEVALNTNHIVISEVQFASEVSSKDEFIELYNSSSEDINLVAYRLSRKTKSGNETNLLTEFPEVVLPTHGYYLVAHEDYDGINPVDSFYSTKESIAADNTIILYSDAGVTVVDKLGVGEAGDFEGEVFAGNPEKDFSVERKALENSTSESLNAGERDELGNAYDSDNNSQDFVMQSEPNSRGLNLAPEPKLLTDDLEYLWHFDECIGHRAFDMIQAGIFEDDFGWSEGVWGCSTSLQKTMSFGDVEISLTAENGISLGFFLQSGGGGLQSVSLWSEEVGQEIKFGLLEHKLVFWNGKNYQFTTYQVDSSWHYYALTIEEKAVKIFIDGVLKSEFNLESEFDNFSKLKIGEAGNINLDELAIWSRVLAEEEIIEIINRLEPLEPIADYNYEPKLYDWKTAEATSTVVSELIMGDDLEIGEAEWYGDGISLKYFLKIASSVPLEKNLAVPLTQASFSINYFFGHKAMGKNLDNSLLFSSDVGIFGFRLYGKKIDVYSNGEIYTFDCSYSAGVLSLIFDSEQSKFKVYVNSRLLGEGDYIYQNHEITSYQISALEDNYLFYSLSIWDGVLTVNQIRGEIMAI